MEVIFYYPDVLIDGVVTNEANIMNDQFNCSQGGSAHRGVFGPLGLLVLTNENFKEQTTVFFYISLLGMVNGSQGFAVMRPGRISFFPQNPMKILITNVSLSYCSNSCRF
jgi:hypothetical protein